MQKLFLKFNDDWKEYALFSGYFYMHNPLTSVSIALDNEDELFNVMCYLYDNDTKVHIYSMDSIKKEKNKIFETTEEYNIFEDQYEEYYDKRFEEMPQVNMLVGNWELLQQKWKKLLETQAQYVVFASVKEGEYDKVDVFGKDELSEDDWAYIKQEHKKYLKYQEAKQKYIENHPDYSEVWRGPQDDEYEADIMKYYDQD